MPEIVEYLAPHAEVHYFGMKSGEKLPEPIRDNAIIHNLPWTVDRTNTSDKFIKTALWLLAIPWMGLQCRIMGMDVVYMDETVPLSPLLARLFFGRNTAITVADFFTDIYFSKPGFMRLAGRVIQAIDRYTWRHIPLIFTRAKSTKSYLTGLGVPEDRVHPVYDPCDFSIYHPIRERTSIRKNLGIEPEHIVLVHHGILHPNKGNDFIIKALASLKNEIPHLRYLLIGDGPDMDRLKQLTQECDMNDRVIFTGWLPSLDQVNDALNAGDIGLVMRTGQRSDDFHMTGALVHSMAAGLPILSARLAGVAEVIHDRENGLLFAPDDVNEFHEKLRMLVQQADLRARFAEKTLALAHEIFDIQHVTSATADPLLDLASGHH